MSVLLALTEGERIAIIGGILAALAAGVPATIAAVVAHRTRRENTEQHGQSQHKLQQLTEAVHHHGGKLDAVAEHVVRIDDKTERLAERIRAAEIRLPLQSTADDHPGEA
jgi:ubiquinone biosynthesis protein UbiJ